MSRSRLLYPFGVLMTAVVVAAGLFVGVPGASVPPAAAAVTEPAPTLGSSLVPYLKLAGDRAYVLPDGTYTAGTVAAPHPATSGRYGGWLVLMAAKPGAVVVDLARQPLTLDASTSRVLFVGFRFVNGTINVRGNDIAFWHTDHRFPAGVWAAQGPAGFPERGLYSAPRAIDATGATGRVRLLGSDVHDTAIGVSASATTDLRIEGTHIWNMTDGSADRNDVVLPQAIVGGAGRSTNLTVSRSWVQGRVVFADAPATLTGGGPHNGLRFERSWFSHSPAAGFTFTSRKPATPRGVFGSRSEVRSWAHGGKERADVVDGVTKATNSSPRVQVADSGIMGSAPAAGAASPADAWRSENPYVTWVKVLPAPTTTTTVARPTTTTTVAPTTTTLPPTTTTTVPASGPSVSAQLGFYPGSPNSGGLDLFEQRETWLGRAVRYFTAYGEGSKLDGFQGNLGGQFRTDRLAQWKSRGQQPPFRLVYMTPLAFGARYDGNATIGALVKEQWDALINNTTVRSSHPTAAGLSRQTYRSLAQTLVANGYGDAIIRLASEHDNRGSRWASEIDYTRFKAAFRAVVDTMRSVAPNLEFDFTNIRLNIGSGTNPGPKVTNAYPGDAYVDYFGMDIYDHGNVAANIGVPSGRKCGWQNPQAVFDTLHRPFLETAKRFAIGHGKRLSLPEWGLSMGGTNFAGRCGGDNPTFVSNMVSWLGTLPAANLGYASYFEGNPEHDGPHELTYFANAKTRFGQLLGD